jgi:hypothetical protein
MTRIAPANGSQYWRDRAVKMRAVVVTMKDSHAHILMNDLADHYDRLADDREGQATTKHKLK